MEFKRKKSENFENFIRRFNKSLQQSRKLYTVRQRQFLVPKKSKIEQKEYALVSMKLRAKREYLRKIGKLKDELQKKW